MVSSKVAGLALAFLSLSAPVHAQESPAGSTPEAPLTLGDIDRIMQDEIRLKALVARAEQQALLEKLAAGESGADVRPEPPRLVARRATTAGWVGTFLYPGGRAAMADVGDILPGGYRVDALDEGTLALSYNGQLAELAGAGPGQATEVR
ncbi:hypothetical protein [uncultured Pigmentiphaga sp.]|uniref:hypothetical protein n=1 Tax=uncultured Pigmentiphaga sp. TaxID=340361 RepID=UPI0026196CA7|nr:hypothetical protein [uncultured Pigmentiphaga sp.]